MELRYWGAILAVTAVASVSFGLGAYSVAISSLKSVDLKDFLTAITTIGSGAGTALALAIAYQANKISRQSAAQQLRPYVFISNSKMYSVDGIMYIGCEIKNSGISNAIDLRIDFQFLIGPLNSRIRDEDMVRFTEFGTIAPGATTTVDRPVTIFTPENIASIRNGQMAVFMRTIASYSWPSSGGVRDGFDATLLCDADYLDRGIFRNIRR